MTHPTIEITTPSRLHFGMFSCGLADRPQFGGVGVMIDRPAVRLRISAAEKFCAHGPLAGRASQFARRWQQGAGLPSPLRCRIEVISAPPEHVGLGVGTQLGMAVAQGLSHFHSLPQSDSRSLAKLVGRGERSAVGVYGFATGGLIVESGKLPGQPLSPLFARREVPQAWRFALLRPEVPGGLSGGDEQQAFARLPPVPPCVTGELWREVNERMLPALMAAEFEQFSESVYRFGRVAGECFSAVQGGPYNGPVLSKLVHRVRKMGVRGVGQSSWGPTLFCLLPSQAEAEQLVRELDRQIDEVRVEFTIAAPCNRGAEVIMLP